MRRREMIHPVVLPDQYHQVAYVEATSYSSYVGFTEKRVQTAEMQKSAATIDVAGGLHSWPEY